MPKDFSVSPGEIISQITDDGTGIHGVIDHLRQLASDMLSIRYPDHRPYWLNQDDNDFPALWVGHWTQMAYWIKDEHPHSEATAASWILILGESIDEVLQGDYEDGKELVGLQSMLLTSYAMEAGLSRELDAARDAAMKAIEKARHGEKFEGRKPGSKTKETLYLEHAITINPDITIPEIADWVFLKAGEEGSPYDVDAVDTSIIYKRGNSDAINKTKMIQKLEYAKRQKKKP